MLMSVDTILLRLFTTSLHQRFMTLHTKNSLRSSSVFQVLNLLLAIPTFEAGCAKSLIACEDCQILNLVPADTAAVGTVVADERSITKKKEVGVGVEDGSAGITAETVYMPSIARWKPISISISQCHHHALGTYQVRRPCLLRGSGTDKS